MQISICPHCQKELPEKFTDVGCPNCQVALPRKFNWLFFGLVLSIPALADFILVNFISNSLDMLGTMIFVSFGGSIISGSVCGIILARWRGGKGFDLVSQTIGFGLLMAFVSFCLCCIGCVVTGIFFK